MTFANQLRRFVEIADLQTPGRGVISVSLYTAGQVTNYLDCHVVTKFGTGRASKIPWIAFLLGQNKVQKGIYPVFLYFRDQGLLFLSFGLSVTNPPPYGWHALDSTQTIREYFEAHQLGRPKKYGSSLVFRVYNPHHLDEGEIDRDLEEIIDSYKQQINRAVEEVKISESESSLKIVDIEEDFADAGLVVGDHLIRRLLSALMSKEFAILTGLSGSGKTKIAQALSKWFCRSDKQMRLIPVGADWTNREPLLGFPNALVSNDYFDTEALRLLLDAESDPSRPYFLILDEMNLSHVERYFADFLSAMESGESIGLHSGPGSRKKIPTEVRFPDNLFIIGTVNIDETTYMFSPKVLDRANVIEFTVNKAEMEQFLLSARPLDLTKLRGKGAGIAADFLATARDKTIVADEETAKAVDEALLLFFDELRKVGAEFGFRTSSEIKRFAAIARMLDPDWPLDDIVDAAIMQKLLPKVHGSRRKLEKVLRILCGLCLKDAANVEAFLGKEFADDPNMELTRYPMSALKVRSMYHNLMSNGFTSYAEA